jgi:CheY-like chemotaxis protein
MLTNAVKFTPNNGSIWLKAQVINNDDDGMCTLKIAVKDTGIGMSPEQQSRLFFSFELAVSSISRKFGGIGLGLAICKRIIELMNGQICVESEPGKGSIFTFTVRLIRIDKGEDKDGGTDEIKQTPSFRGRRILLAEDVEINREIVLLLLEPTEMEIDCATNGAEALKMFSDAPDYYDMIFMDMQMPQMDGLEATRQIRAFESKMEPDTRKPIPIVAMTANVFKEDIDNCLDAGMNDHVGKPLDYNEVIDVLTRFLSSK